MPFLRASAHLRRDICSLTSFCCARARHAIGVLSILHYGSRTALWIASPLAGAGCGCPLRTRSLRRIQPSTRRCQSVSLLEPCLRVSCVLRRTHAAKPLGVLAHSVNPPSASLSLVSCPSGVLWPLSCRPSVTHRARRSLDYKCRRGCARDLVGGGSCESVRRSRPSRARGSYIPRL